jgi:hypothetical protein
MKTFGFVICWVTCHLILLPPAQAELQVGAAIVDITPQQLPVLVNGGMLSKSANAIMTHVNARAIVIDDGSERIGIVVVDSCMLPKFLLDEAKQLATAKTKLKSDRILISATHTHTAPSSFGCLGTDPDPLYVPFLRQRLVEALIQAEKKLQPARVGWGVAKAEQFTALRRWVRRPDRLAEDPFGNPTVRANMHAATKPEDVTGQSGPEDPDLSMIVFQATDGTPIATLANFSMHYFSDKAISADYFGLFCDGLQQYVKQRHPKSEMVGIMSHGCSGDVWRRDYMTWKSGENPTIEGYTQGLLEIAKQVYESVEFEESTTLAMAESRIPMKYRVPNRQLLDWSKRIVDAMESGTPKDRLEVYAREQVLLDRMQSTEIVLQAIRIGDIAIASTPTETYALTGLKIKAQSPYPKTMVIELANGADGYIPPPEQHLLGGYNTWAARSAGLEVTAEPRIVATAVNLLETVTRKPRRHPRETAGVAAHQLLAAKPVAYYRFSETEAPVLIDQSGNHHNGVYEPGVCFYLPGPDSPGHQYTSDGDVNRCAHFAGGRARTRLASLTDSYCISMEFWNGMPNDARATTGWLLSNDYPHAISQNGEHLGISGSGSDTPPGRLILQQGKSKPVLGKTEIPRWKWNHLLLVKDGKRLRVYLNKNPEPEIDVAIEPSSNRQVGTYFIGGRSDNESNFEGRIDEVAFFQGVPTSLLPHNGSTSN